ncbi:MAG: alpha/beta hydrolase [Gordonia sp. (in: high G+C Gram-positive bacteria)]|uniref:dienelactone hydrolase family protein n=1 Tax=Gordonia sp. (in: high G+C Gram-positive bacteria) TaxID=84139 RepID=UPI0039E4D57D
MIGKKKVVAPPPDQSMKDLARRGPHKVDRGDLGIVGLAGQVFAPRTGTDLPAIAFGHAWLRDSAAYRDLMFHLASWGIVVAAPDSERGPLASDIELATDLRAALTVVQSVRLGTSDAITVDPEKVGLVGHGFGAAAAVRAASAEALLGRPQIPVKALIPLFPAPTTATLLPAAESVTAPTLIVAGAGEIDSMAGNALVLAQTVGGDVVLRTLPGGDSKGLLERFSPKSLIGINGAERKLHAAVRAQVTGFLLHRLTGDERYAAFSDPEVAMGGLLVVDPATQRRADVDHFAQLLGVAPFDAAAEPPADERDTKGLPAAR